MMHVLKNYTYSRMISAEFQLLSFLINELKSPDSLIPQNLHS